MNWEEACARLDARRVDVGMRQLALMDAARRRPPIREALVAAVVRYRMGYYTDPALEARDAKTSQQAQHSFTDAEWDAANERWDAILKARGAWWLPPVNED